LKPSAALVIPFLAFLCCAVDRDGSFPPLAIPARPLASPAAEQVLLRMEKQSPDEREKEILHQLASGNLPDFLRRPVEIEVEVVDSDSVRHRIRIAVLPDYLSVGTDSAFCRLPMRPETAQRLADQWNLLLPTPCIVDWIDAAARLRIEPVTYAPEGDCNEQAERFRAHQQDIEARHQAQPGILTSGLKKDIVLCSRIDSSAVPDRVAIYGWRRPDRSIIQPLYCGHTHCYVDYSHGVRLIQSTAFIDGKSVDLRKALCDTLLFRLFSDEDAPLIDARYPLEQP